MGLYGSGFSACSPVSQFEALGIIESLLCRLSTAYVFQRDNRLDDGALRMYYTGQSSDGSTAIGVAKFDASTGAWAREQAEFSFAA